jgi:hypothetical protein
VKLLLLRFLKCYRFLLRADFLIFAVKNALEKISQFFQTLSKI